MSMVITNQLTRLENNTTLYKINTFIQHKLVFVTGKTTAGEENCPKVDSYVLTPLQRPG